MMITNHLSLEATKISFLKDDRNQIYRLSTVKNSRTNKLIKIMLVSLLFVAVTASGKWDWYGKESTAFVKELYQCKVETKIVPHFSLSLSLIYHYKTTVV